MYRIKTTQKDDILIAETPAAKMIPMLSHSGRTLTLRRRRAAPMGQEHGSGWLELTDGDARIRIQIWGSGGVRHSTDRTPASAMSVRDGRITPAQYRRVFADRAGRRLGTIRSMGALR